MKNPVDSFFEYVSVRERRERLMMRLAAVAVAYGLIYTAALLVYIAVR